MADGSEITAKARNDFADLLDSLSDEQLAGNTLCDNWTPMDVAGHVVSFVELGLGGLMFSMAKAGFNVDKAWAANATKYKEMGRDAISAALREKADKSAPIPSFSAGISFLDVAVHTQDIRRGLGLEGELDEEVLRASLEWVTTHKQRKTHVDPKDIEGLRFEATDMDWSWGEGDLVSGPAEAILMAMNRRDTSADLTGDGVAKLPI